MREFLLRLFLYHLVALVHHLTDEAGVLLKVVEIAAATQHKSLVQGVLQPVVGLLGDAVLVGFPGIDRCGAQAVVNQKFGVGLIEDPAAAALYLVGQCRGVVGADHLGVAPARMAKYQLEQQVPVGSASDGDAQGAAVGEVDLGLAARWVLLGEVNLLIRPVERSPVL